MCAAPVQVVHHAQTVHLITEHFEAQCDSLHSSSSGEPHLIVLEGNVRLISKTSGKPMRLEAPRVIINTRDGTVTVEGTSTMQTLYPTGMAPICVPSPIPTIPPAVVPIQPSPSSYYQPVYPTAPMPAIAPNAYGPSGSGR
jgi:hypothetical protein